MKFDSNYPRADPHERSCQGAGTRSEVDDEIGLADAGSIDDVASCAVIEPVKAPTDR